MIRLEENLLKAFKIDLGSKTLRDEQVVVRKRKNFDDLTSETSKNARLNNVVEMLESDMGLEEKAFEMGIGTRLWFIIFNDKFNVEIAMKKIRYLAVVSSK